MRQVIFEARFALRRLAKAPAFALFSIGTLGLGIAATTAVYAAMHGLFWRGSGVRNPGTLVALGPANAPLPIDDYRALRDRNGIFTSVAGSYRFSSALSGNGRAEYVGGTAVTGSWFSTLGVDAALGRAIQPIDDTADAPLTVVLSDLLWREQFAADRGMVGRTVRMAGRSFEVVGVAPRGFTGLDSSAGVAAWISMAAARVMSGTGGSALSPDPDEVPVSVVGRLAPGMTVDAAARDLAAIAATLDATRPLAAHGSARAGTTPGRAASWRPSPAVRQPLSSASLGGWLIVAMPGLVLLVACTNLANLALSRGIARRHEDVVRLALGASRWHLVRAHVIEGAMVAATGAGLGWFIAETLVARVVAFVADRLPHYRFLLDVRLDGWSVAASIICGLLSLLVFGLAPALQLTRPGRRTGLSTDAAMAALPRWKGRNTLVAWQVTVSVGLFLVMAVTLKLPYVGSVHDDLDAEGVALGVIPLRAQQYTGDRAQRTLDRIVTLLRAAPAVSGVGLLAGLAEATGVSGSDGMWADLSPEQAAKLGRGGGAYVVLASPGALRTLGIPLRAGREFDGRDGSSSGAVVVSEGLAQALFGPAPAIGRELHARIYPILTNPAARESVPLGTYTVVGVTANATYDGTHSPQPMIFRPIAGTDLPTEIAVVARTASRDARLPTAALRTAVAQADPELAMPVVAPAAEILQPQSRLFEPLLWFCGSMAAVALILSMTGLYGVLSHVVLCRTREIGVRAALGAERGDIVRLVLEDGARPVLKGLALALLFATAFRLLVQTQETVVISPFDPFAIAVAVIPTAIAAAIACYLPARRASRVDPNVALRAL